MWYILDTQGRRLCCDGQFRNFASFGDYPECVKAYRHKGHAIARRQRCKAAAELIELRDGESMDASGNVYLADDGDICPNRTVSKRVGIAAWCDNQVASLIDLLEPMLGCEFRSPKSLFYSATIAIDREEWPQSMQLLVQYQSDQVYGRTPAMLLSFNWYQACRFGEAKQDTAPCNPHGWQGHWPLGYPCNDDRDGSWHIVRPRLRAAIEYLDQALRSIGISAEHLATV